MGHRTITIPDEAYMIPSNLKREKKSFTDFIKRVFKEPRRRPLNHRRTKRQPYLIERDRKTRLTRGN